jgi:hypothetical protein
VPPAVAPASTHDDLQRRRTPAERLIRQPPDHRVSRDALAATAAAPLIGIDHPAREHCAVGLDALPGGFKTELVDPAQRSQVRAGDEAQAGGVVHIALIQMDGVGTSAQTYYGAPN